MQHHTVYAPDARTGRVEAQDYWWQPPTNQDGRTPHADANRYITKVLARAGRGDLDPAVALHMVEAAAAAVDVRVYDAAVDALDGIAIATGRTLDAQPWRVARKRQRHHDGLDAQTRRARRHSQRQIGRGPARAGVPTDDGTGIRDTRATDRTWRGERGGATESQPVIALRPVWQATADGVVSPVPRTAHDKRHQVRDQVILPTERLAPWTPDVPDARAIRAQRRAIREAEARERAARLERESLEASSVPLSH